MGVVLLITFALYATAAEPAERAIVGAWECKRGPCFDPEIEFAVEEGERVFRSWLHHRPSAFGRWSVDGETLTIESGGGGFDYRIVRVNRKELVLRGEGDREDARYVRIKE